MEVEQEETTVSTSLGADRGALARAVATAASNVPGVSRLVPGSGVPVATHYPGGVVPGVGLGPEAVSVHVVVDTFPLEPIVTGVVAAVGRTLADVGDPRRVEVVVEDVEDRALERMVKPQRRTRSQTEGR